MDKKTAPRKMVIQGQDLNAPPTDVFPLLCPVREYEWIEGWDCTVVHLQSGYAEEDGVFKTSAPNDGGEDTWVITRYLPPQEIEFVRVNPWRVIRYNIQLKPTGEGGTRALWRQLITATSEEGARYVEAFDEAAFARLIERLGEMINHFLATGQKLVVSG